MPTTPVSIDVTRMYVRLVKRRTDGFIEFEFAYWRARYLCRNDFAK
ncbi:phenol hydroxylase subunit [Castellaniella sp.]|nr:phenol hydroxylase subunit [Castellaniella sp.]